MFYVRKGAITRQDIMQFPFPYKLWLVVHLEYCDFIRWNCDGTMILIDLTGLDEYLKSTLSIFRIKSYVGFLQHLQDFNFEPVNVASEADEKVLLQFKNDNFRMHHKELLCKIRANRDQLGGYSSVLVLGQKVDVEQSRAMYAKITLEFENAKRLLKRQMDAVADGRLPATEIPEEYYENPHNSSMKDVHPEYAGGYYGNLGKEELIEFYGDFLPIDKSSPPDTSGIVVVPSDKANLNDSSVLEPIIKLEVEEDYEETNPNEVQNVELNNFGIKEEITMEGSVKFENLSESSPQTAEESFAQMLTPVKEGPVENEADFY